VDGTAAETVRPKPPCKEASPSPPLLFLLLSVSEDEEEWSEPIISFSSSAAAY
jgi:hypothetical protein